MTGTSLARELDRRVALARKVGTDLRAQLASLAGQDGRFDTALAYGDGAIARILAALDGETRPEALRFQGVVALRPPTPAERELEPAGDGPPLPFDEAVR